MAEYPTISQLLSPIIEREDDEAARNAWFALYGMSRSERIRLLQLELATEGPGREIVAEFLYGYGHWHPEDSLEIVSPLDQGGNEFGWQIVAICLARAVPLVSGEDTNPFERIPQGSVIVMEPLGFNAAYDLIYQCLCEFSDELCLELANSIVCVPSIQLLQLLVDLLTEPRCNEDARLIACLAIKTIAEPISATVDRREWGDCAERLAEIVSNKSLDSNLRSELAYVFEQLPIQSGADAVQRIIDETEQTGFGSYYLPSFRRLKIKIDDALPRSDERPVKRADPGEIAAGLLQRARSTVQQLWDPTVEAYAHGGEFVGATETKVIHFSNEVVDLCLGMIAPCHEDDPELCDRYVTALAHAAAMNGPVDAARRAIVTGVDRARARDRPKMLLEILQLAPPYFGRVKDDETSAAIFDLGADGIAAGNSAHRQGNRDLAHGLFSAVLALAEGLEPEVEAAALGSLGILHSESGDHSAALECTQRAKELLLPLGPSENLATSYMEIANAQITRQDWQAADRTLDEAIAIAEPLETETNLTCLPHCLMTKIEVGLNTPGTDSEHLMQIFDQAYSLSLRRNDYQLQHSLLQQKARIQRGLTFDDRLQKAYATIRAGQEDDLWAAINTALDEAREIESRARAMEFSTGSTSLWGFALRYYIEAYIRLSYAEEMEVLCNSGAGVEVSNLVHERMAITDRIVALLIADDDVNWAFEFADRTKSRSMLRFCVLARQDVLELAKNAGASNKLLERIRKSAQALADRAHQEPLHGSPDERDLHLSLQELQGQLPPEFRRTFGIGEAGAEYDALIKEKREWKEFTGNGPPPAGRTGHLQNRILPNLAKRLSGDERLVQYYLYEEGGHAFVVDPAGGVRCVPISIDDDRLKSLIDIVTTDPQVASGSGSSDAQFVDWTAALTELYAALIEPLTPCIEQDDRMLLGSSGGVRKLYIIPHGVLCNLPFGILFDGTQQRYLIQDFELAIVPSGSIFNMLQHDKGTISDSASISIMADPKTSLPRLPEATREAGVLISSLSPSVIVANHLTDTNLTRDAFASCCEDADIVHFAGHVVFDEDSPGHSYIPLSAKDARPNSEDRLTCADMMASIRMRANLFVLNGCYSGKSDSRRPDEILGFLRASLICGAQNVLYTLWPLPDSDETVSITRRFYDALLSDGLDTSKALREAVLPFTDKHPWLWGGLCHCGVS